MLSDSSCAASLPQAKWDQEIALKVPFSDRMSHVASTGIQRVIEMQHGQLEGLAELYNAQKLEIEQVRTILSAQLARKLEEHRQQIETLTTKLAGQQEALKGLNGILSRQQEEPRTLFEQQSHAIDGAVQALHKEIALDLAVLTQRMDGIDTNLEQLRTAGEAIKIIALGYQKRADGQEQRVEELWKLLQGEIAARQALEQQVQQSTSPRKRTI